MHRPGITKVPVVMMFVAGLSALLVAQGTPPAPPPPNGGAVVPGQAPAGRGAPAPAGPAAAPRPAPSQAAIDHANQVLADARKAMGGDKLAAVKTLVASGQTKRVRGNNLVPIEFEIDIELPDKYVRKDEVPAEESDPTSTGFNGAELIQLPLPAAPPAAARAGGPAPAAALEAQKAARLAAAKQDFSRLALGLVVDSPAYPLTFAYSAKAEAPQGTADVIDATGPGNFLLRLFINSATHLPVMVSWQSPPTSVIVTVPGQPPPATVAPGAVVVQGPPAPAASAAQAEKDQYAKDVQALRAKTQAMPVENRLYYQDYRDVDGLQLPFKLRRAIGTDTTEETTFDRFRVNTKIDPKKFQTSK